MENKIIKTIKNRVSCRNFSEKKVELSKVKLIAEAGKMAPSARNRQISNILVVRSKKNVDELKKLSQEVFQRDCFYGAATLILVYADKNDRFAIHDCSCILENMFIAATSLNVNSCWINQVDDMFNTKSGKKVKKSLTIDDNAMIVGTCALGYSIDPSVLKIKDRKEDFIKIL